MTSWLPQDHRAVADLEVRRSRFIATVARVDDEATARAVIADARRTWPDARHHCSAFIVEVPGAQPVERSSDDGEPSGTAGRPMLDVLRGADLSQVVAVVTRYFGGVKLGTGGLVRAYSDAVALALLDVPRVQPVVRPVFEVSLSYPDAGRVQEACAAHDLEVLGVDYGDSVSLRVAGEEPELREVIARITHGQVLLQDQGHVVTEQPLPATRPTQP